MLLWLLCVFCGRSGCVLITCFVVGWCNIVFLVSLVLGCLGFKFRFCGLTLFVRWLGWIAVWVAGLA